MPQLRTDSRNQMISIGRHVCQDERRANLDSAVRLLQLGKNDIARLHDFKSAAEYSTSSSSYESANAVVERARKSSRSASCSGRMVTSRRALGRISTASSKRTCLPSKCAAMDVIGIAKAYGNNDSGQFRLARPITPEHPPRRAAGRRPRGARIPLFWRKASSTSHREPAGAWARLAGFSFRRGR